MTLKFYGFKVTFGMNLAVNTVVRDGNTFIITFPLSLGKRLSPRKVEFYATSADRSIALATDAF